MPEGTINQAVMTPYEIIATVLAVIALVQPWILAAFACSNGVFVFEILFDSNISFSYILIKRSTV